MSFCGAEFQVLGYKLPFLQDRDRKKQVDLWGEGCSVRAEALLPLNDGPGRQAGSCDLTPAGSQHKFSLAWSTSCQACQLPRALPLHVMKEPGWDQPRQGEAVLPGERHVHTALALPCYTGSAVLPSGHHSPKLDWKRL